MIIIKKGVKNIPPKLNGAICQRLKELSLIEKGAHKFSSAIYRDGAITELTKLYKSKCGYCETDTTAGSALRIDHYRPKNKIIEDTIHPGYYWLGYEWTNLILSCEKCNRYKSNHFPILGKRLSTPIITKNGTLLKSALKSNSRVLINENPLILNPELDNVYMHLTFLSNGKIVGLSEKGKKTIDTCKLNREELVLKRKKLIDTFYSDLKKNIIAFFDNKR